MPLLEAMTRIQEIRTTIDTLAGAETAPARAALPAAETSTTLANDSFTKLLSDAAASAGLPTAASRSSAVPTSGDLPSAAAPLDPVTGSFPAWATPANGTTAANPQGATGADFVASAKKYLGVPYVWGGNNPKTGLDCSSLVQQAFKDLGIEVPRIVRYQMSYGTEVASLAEARPGDLIVTRGGQHIGIYLGDNKLLHAPRPGEDVQIREMFETDKDITSIRRIVPPTADAASPSVPAPTGGNDVGSIIAAAQSSFLAGIPR